MGIEENEIEVTEGERLSIVERIRFQTEIIKVVSLFILAVATGVLSLIMDDIKEFKPYIGAFFGLLLILLLFGFVIFVYRDNEKLLKLLEK